MFHLQHEKHNLSPKHKTFKKISLDFLVSAKNIYVLLIRYELCSRDNLIIYGAKSCKSQYLDKVLYLYKVNILGWFDSCLPSWWYWINGLNGLYLILNILTYTWFGPWKNFYVSFSLRTELFFTKTQEVNQYIALRRMK